ncbi:MAG: glycosyltransferase family 2 protein [Candidatus Eremiobacteraeota bacterium]|nr:glycosyltransferase family 2 protein [Candidatus Eremiobacteraeota bacterium]
MLYGVGSSLSVVIPAFNEAAGIEGTVQRVLSSLADGEGGAELVIVDDGSTDETWRVLCELADRYEAVVPIRHSANYGVDAAVASGVRAAAGSCIVTFDADLTYDPALIPRLAAVLDEAGAQIVLASAYMRGGRVSGVPWVRRCCSLWANRYLSLATKGAIATLTCLVRAYDAQLVRRLIDENDSIETTYGLLFAALSAGARVVEIPAHLDWSHQPKERVQRLAWRRIAQRISLVAIAGARYRRSLLLAVPGLVPGLVPLVVLAAALFHASAAQIAALALGTFILQCVSLALGSLQIGHFAFRRHSEATTCR